MPINMIDILAYPRFHEKSLDKLSSLGPYKKSIDPLSTCSYLDKSDYTQPNLG